MATDALDMERLLKGLAEAKHRVEQAVLEDSKFPDLLDQLANQSEPQNYFFEPYASQWCPQVVKKGSLIPLPSVIATSMEEEMQSLTLSGLLTPLDHAWTSVDHRLFLWSYKQRGRFVVFEFDQPVVAVGLCVTPRAGVFTDKVKHLLVVATTVEVVLVAVLYEDSQSIASGLRLQRTKLSVSTDNTVVRRIVTTAAHGRIFFGGSDGGVFELLYGPSTGTAAAASSALGFDASLFIPSFLQRSGCRKVTHTSRVANYLPSFLSALASSPGKLTEFALDEDRQILYALHEQGDVDVFDLGVHGNEMKLVCTLNLLTDGAKYARENRRTRVSCPDERIFQQANLKIVSLAVVSRNESALVSLVAVASNGIRFFLTVYSRRAYTVGNTIPPSRRPTRLETLYIRLPPPAVSISDAPPYHAKEGMQPGFAPGKSPSNVHLAYHKRGVLLLVDGPKDQQDQLVGVTHDPITSSLAATPATRGKPTVRESVALESCIGKIVDLQELGESAIERSQRMRDAASAATRNGSSTGSKRSFEEMTNGFTSNIMGNDMVPMVGEMAVQYSDPSRHFLCLSSAGIQVFKKIRPIDQLHRVLLLSRGSDLKATLAPFIRSFGEIQVCCMLIALACGVQSDPLMADGTTAAAAAAASVSMVHRAGVKSDEYIFTTAMQGIFECGQLAQARSAADMDTSSQSATGSNNTRIVLTTDFGMSYHHDGLVMFVCRVLRPLWFVKSIGRRVSNNSSTYELAHSREKLDEIREILFQLRQLMESAGPFAVSISSGSILENSIDWNDADASTRAAELAGQYQKHRNEEQLKREMRFKAEQRSLYFIYQLVLRSIEAISLLRFTMEHHVPLDETFARLGFGELVSSAEGSSAAKTMIKALMKGRNENNQFLVKQLREQCPSYFSVSDLWHYQGYKSLAMAKLSAPSGRKAHLRESLSQFLNACHMWDTGDCIEVLQGICDDYALLNFYEGVVKLSLACAKNFHDAAATDLTGVKLTWKRNCFGCILLALQRLLDPAGRSPQAVDDMVSLDDEARGRFVEEVLHYALASEDSDFHELLYTWLYEHGHTHLLTSIRSSFIEDFLKEKDQDLLIKMYMEQQKYLVAAKVWWSRAHEDSEDISVENNPDILKRQYYVSKSLGCLKSIEDVSEAADAIREVRDVLDVLQLQVRVLKALEQATVELEASASSSSSLSTSSIEAEINERKTDLQLLTYKIFDASTLYNRFASKYDMWSECLHIIHACNSEEADVIESLWRKIIFSVMPPSSTSQEFNVWRADQCDLAGLTASQPSNAGSMASSFENGYWIGQLQGNILRLGKSLYTDGAGADRGGAAGAALSNFVFPVGFLAKQLERISSWYLRLTQLPAFSVSSSSVDATTVNWVLRVFIDVGVPHRSLLSYYERLYHEQGSVEWTLHLLQSVHSILSLWKKHAISPRAGQDQLQDYAECCPHLVAMCDDIVTDLQALSSDGRREVAILLEKFRRYKSELLSFRNPM
ncbi:hypothetical protein Poli38472_003824 [Pythium oligandrum]|uniref:Nuclear pore complex protein n=1 Tax=Pythium oligandrum TaxID=41045 RepID=A0A8K1FM98_PYTOL|nr:hypothetical protein Poli38472_003824 [Pythium oligandrum]|eukprot:TMW66059.1 hypothetical protein Poli38472_003824 [Pythium oligandrum]